MHALLNVLHVLVVVLTLVILALEGCNGAGKEPISKVIPAPLDRHPPKTSPQDDHS